MRKLQVSPEQLLPNVHNLNDLVAQNHVYIAGPSGSGKSVLSDHVYDGLTDTVRVFFNPEEEPIKAAHARRPADLRTYLRQGELRLEYTPPPNVEAMRRDLEEIHDLFFQLGDKHRKGRHKVEHWATLFAAEAQLYSPKEDKDGPLPDWQRRGRKRGLRAVVDNQEPAMVSHTVLKQSAVKLLFQFDPIEMEYFRKYSVPIDEMAEHLAQPHCFAMVKGSKWVAYDKLPYTG